MPLPSDYYVDACVLLLVYEDCERLSDRCMYDVCHTSSMQDVRRQTNEATCSVIAINCILLIVCFTMTCFLSFECGCQGSQVVWWRGYQASGSIQRDKTRQCAPAWKHICFVDQQRGYQPRVRTLPWQIYRVKIPLKDTFETYLWKQQHAYNVYKLFLTTCPAPSNHKAEHLFGKWANIKS